MRVYYLTKHFLKVHTAYKINFLSILVFPVIGIISQFSDYVFQSISINEYFEYLSIWLAYMVTITAFTIGHQLVSLREQQFLKQFVFITKDPKIIILSLIISQFIVLIGTVSILTLVSTILFGVSLVKVGLFSIGSVVLPFIPLSMLFLVLNLISIHYENLQPIVTISTALMLFYINFMQVGEASSFMSLFINPMNFALEAGKIWSVGIVPYVPINYVAVLFTGFMYIMIGFVATRFTRISANFRI